MDFFGQLDLNSDGFFGCQIPGVVDFEWFYVHEDLKSFSGKFVTWILQEPMVFIHIFEFF